MRTARLVLAEAVFQSKLFWRVPIAAFFTFIFPLMFLVLFNSLNMGATLTSQGGIAFAQWFTPGIAVFALVTAAYTNLAITTSQARDEGILKRVKSTPVPVWVYMAGRILAALWVGVLSIIVMFGVGAMFFGVQIIWAHAATSLVVLAVGAASFAALGVAVAGVAPNAQAAPAIANFTILPLSFVSGIFFPIDSAPTWLVKLAAFFPLQPFAKALLDLQNPYLTHIGVPWSALANMGAWFVVGLLLAARSFSIEPRAEGGGRRRRSAARS